MRASQPYETALQAGAVLSHILRPFVEQHAPVPGDPQSWIELISRSDLQRLGRHDAEYALDDPRVILKTIIFHPEQFGEMFTKTDIGWGHQIRSYVLQPYQLVKDLRTGVTSTAPSDVLDGGLTPFMAAALSQRVTGEAVEVEDVD